MDSSSNTDEEEKQDTPLRPVEIVDPEFAYNYNDVDSDRYG